MRPAVIRVFLWVFFAGALVLNPALRLSAQESVAQINGVVTDASGAVLSNASALIAMNGSQIRYCSQSGGANISSTSRTAGMVMCPMSTMTRYAGKSSARCGVKSSLQAGQ